MSTAIVVDNISKSYRLGEFRGAGQLRDRILSLFSRGGEVEEEQTVWALKNVAFSVERGEVVGLVGRNGAGKSTLLKVLSRITHPTEGEVLVDGRIASLLEVGTGFHEELTGRENVYLNGSILGMSRQDIDRRFDEIVAFAGVSKFIDTPIKRYSSGMRLRLGFAVAAHLESEILAVDEVLAVGDAEFQRKCIDAMGDLHEGGRTVMFVSHNMSAVENLCSRVIWVEGGCIKMDGPSSEVISAYMASFGATADSDHNLEAIEDRRGNGYARYIGVGFYGADGRPRDLVRSGDALRIRLQYRVNRRIENPHFGIRIHTDMGALVTDTSTWAHGVDTPFMEPGTGTVEFEVDTLNLMPGRYFLSFWIAATGSVHFDGLEHCLSLDVEGADCYGSGRGIDKLFGIMVMPCRWSVAHSADASVH